MITTMISSRKVGDLEKLSLGEIVKKIVSEELSYQRFKIGSRIERQGRDLNDEETKMRETYTDALKVLYDELYKREGKICVCSRNESE